MIKNLLRIRYLKRMNKIGQHVHIHPHARIGNNCRIGNYVSIADTVTLGNRVKIGSGVTLVNTTIGDNSELDGRTVITGHGSGHISIGSDSYIGPDTALDFSEDVSIGSYVHIAGLSTGLWTHSSVSMCLNRIALNEKSDRYRPRKPIVIEDSVYIGGNCTIYPGVTIGHHSVIAPNSVVNKDVPPYSMYGGVPAKHIKSTKDMIIDG